MSDDAPSEADQERAKWALLQAQIRQAKWETPKTVAMMAIALAALIAASRLADLWIPVRPQNIIIHFDQPT
jgi:hypothetical protein